MSEPGIRLSKNRPVLIIADQSMDVKSGGTTILRSLFDGLLGNGVCWASPNHFENDPSSGKYALPRRAPGRDQHGDWLSDYLWHRRRLSNEALRLASTLDACALWTVMHGISVQLAADLLKKSSLPMHLTVHDDPVYATALRSRKMLPFLPLISRDFSFAMRRALSIDVVSPEMGSRYERRYGVKSVVLHRALSKPVEPNLPPSLARDQLTMGILGNTYAYRQLPLIAESLIEAAKRLNVSARIVCCGDGLGDRLRQEFSGRLDVQYLGHLAEHAAIERLRKCFFLYLNYPFSPWCRVLRETSFPTKLSSYLYAARPILIHAPLHTSLDDLTKDPTLFAHWSSEATADGVNVILELVRRSENNYDFDVAADRWRGLLYGDATHRSTLTRLLSDLARLP